ncbi:MAG: HAD-IA family hydrolase [Rhodospirillales bacterium]
MANRIIDTIIFDLDGTLIDSALDVGVAVNKVLVEQGFEPIDDQTSRDLMGEGGKAMVAKAFRLRGHELTEATLLRLTRRFIDHYRADPVGRTTLYPGVADVVAGLHGEGISMAVCTNKFEQPARDILDALGLSRYIGDVAGADTFAMRKPDPGHLLHLLRRFERDHKNAVMVGDSIHDVQAAKAAGIPVIAVTWGYTIEPAASFGADVLIDRFSALPEALRGLAALPRLS